MTTLWHELGRSEGYTEGLQQSLRRLLETQFGPLPVALVQDLELIADVEKLDALIILASRATSLAEFARQLPPP